MAAIAAAFGLNVGRYDIGSWAGCVRQPIAVRKSDGNKSVRPGGPVGRRPASAASRTIGHVVPEFGGEGEREGVEGLVRAPDPAAAQRPPGHALACSGKFAGDTAGVLDARLRGVRD